MPKSVGYSSHNTSKKENEKNKLACLAMKLSSGAQGNLAQRGSFDEMLRPQDTKNCMVFVIQAV